MPGDKNEVSVLTKEYSRSPKTGDLYIKRTESKSEVYILGTYATEPFKYVFIAISLATGLPWTAPQSTVFSAVHELELLAPVGECKIMLDVRNK